MLQFALQFVRAGVPIVPVQVYRDGDRWRKRPHVEKWALLATTSTKQIEAWWAKWPLALVGVPLERVGLVVVDCDRHGNGQDGVAALAAIDLPPHQAVVTMSNGEHHFFRQPAPRIRWLRWAGGEVLGDGRFVIGYSVEPFVTRAPVLPADLLDRLPKARRVPQIGTTHNVPFVADVGNKEIPKSLYDELLRLIPLSDKVTRHDLRRARGILWVITSKRKDRNDAVHDAACMFRELIYIDVAPRDVAERLLFHAAELSGYVAKDGAAATMATIRSGLGSAGLVQATDGTLCVLDQMAVECRD